MARIWARFSGSDWMKISSRYRAAWFGIAAAAFAGWLLPSATSLAQESQPAKDSVKVKPYTGPPIYLDEPEKTVEPTVVRTQMVTENYKDCKVRVEREIANFSDNHFEADGVYKEYYPNGKLFVEGTYRRGRQNGEWKYYHDNGQLNRVANYKDGKPDGSRDVFRADGTLSAKRGFADGVRDGDWITYDKTGKTPVSEEHYVKGKEDGTWKYWYPNGKQKQQITLKQGVRDGVTTEWDDKGEKRFEATFANGKLHGTATRWFPGGRKIEQKYEEGKLVSQQSS
jgi:antitoxin component YwqK of YwqJK toxin-antitoxin module